MSIFLHFIDTFLKYVDSINIIFFSLTSVLSEESDEETYTINAYYVQDDENVHIMGENIELKGTYDGKTLSLTE